jgi:hypothetical protein
MTDVIREDDLADNITLEPSIRFKDQSAAVAQKDGNNVCWCCFEILMEGRQTDLKMNEAIVRVCDDRECVRKVGEANAKRDKDGGAGKLIITPPRKPIIVP